MKETPCAIDDIWQRTMNISAPITESDFLMLAYWAYHAMPPENVRGVVFRLFESVHICSRAPLH